MKNKLLLTLLCCLLVHSAIAQVPSYVPKDSLVGWWPFTKNTKEIAQNGVVSNKGTGLKFSQDRFGTDSSSIELNGSCYVETQISKLPKGNRTISFWVKIANTQNQHTLINYGKCCNKSTLIGYNVCSKNCFYLTGGIADHSLSMNGITPTNWNHILITFNSKSGSKFYVNGKYTSSSSESVFENLSDTTLGKIAFGAAYDGSGFAPYIDGCVNLTIGNLDDIGIWNRTLDSNEVKGLYLSCNSTYVKSQIDYNSFLGTNQKLTCFNDSVKLKPTRSFVKYKWSTGSTDSFLNVKNSGNISLIGTDKYGCQYFDTVNLFIANSKIYKTKDTLCNSDSLKLSIIEKIKYTTSPTYLWNNTINSKDFTIKGQGKFITKLTIKTPNGNCYDSTISYLSNPIYKFTADTFLNKDCSRNGLKMKVSNTNWNSLVWNDGTNDTLKLIDKTGTYSVTFKDKYSCTYFDDFYYENPGKPVLQNMLTNQIHCFGLNDGEIKVRTIGGFHPIQYSWNSTISSDTNKSNLTKGNYKIVSIDKFQCKDSISVEIIEPKQLTIQLISKNSPSCSNKTDGNAEIEITGGKLPYTILWNDSKSQNSKTASDLNSGKYQVIVQDSSLCSDSLKVSIDTSLNHPPQVLSNPSSQGLKQGNALFVVTTTNNVKSFQWQTNLGTGWSDLSNAGQYSGVNTDSLIITQVSGSNNNQVFRCIISGDCGKDTSNEAKLSIWGVGIQRFTKNEIKVFPNPVKSTLTILGLNAKNYTINNSVGQIVLHGNYQSTIDVSQLNLGVYILHSEYGNVKFIKE